MKDTKKLYLDFVKFFKRFRYFCQKQNYGRPEYLAIAEPQARGCWHLHAVLVFDKRAPFIPNDTLADLWGHGFVHIRSIENADNVGAYLCCYLADIELPDDDRSMTELGMPKGNFPIVERQVDGQTKRFIKGGRLHLYPAGMNLYRASRGIRQPVKKKMTLEAAEKMTADFVKTYEKTIQFSDPRNDFSTTIYTRYFNRARNK